MNNYIFENGMGLAAKQLDAAVCKSPSGKTYPAYRAAGMRSLLRAVRSVGARQPVLLGGLAYAKDLSRWLRYKPRDPARQLVASLHTYGPARRGRRPGRRPARGRLLRRLPRHGG